MKFISYIISLNNLITNQTCYLKYTLIINDNPNINSI